MLHSVEDQATTSLPATRRRFLRLVFGSLAASPWLRAAAQSPAPAVGLAQFMRISRVLTGYDDLNDEAAGREYFDALTSRAGMTRTLAELWRRGGFESAEPPVSVDDLAERGIYDRADLAELADTITANWYSGIYVTPDGEQRVATYTRALAWRTLGYRPAGPSACGGAFGHWAERPPGV